MLVQFLLAMSTLGRPRELEGFLAGLAKQDASVHLVCVDQSINQVSADVLKFWPNVKSTLIPQAGLLGLSKGRNRALRDRGLSATYVAFPDDDCVYPHGLLERVQDVFLATGADVVTGRQVTPGGDDSMLRWRRSSGFIGIRDVPRTVNSSSLFFSYAAVKRIGEFDEHLGAGAGTPCGAGEESDYVIRAIKQGMTVFYDPEIAVIQHDWRQEGSLDVTRKVYSYNYGFGCVLRKHHLHMAWIYWTLRSVAAVLASVFRRDSDAQRYQVAQLHGRIEGYFKG